MVKNVSTSNNGETTEPTWLNWCRLCAKKSNAGHENSMIFTKDINSILTTSIGKFFWVNIKPEDEIPKRLCRECQKLVDELVAFTERVNKVQTMYCILQNLKQTTVDAANKLRSQFGVSDEGWEHIIKINETPPPPHKPEVANQEVQTDLIIFFNKQCQELTPPSHYKPSAQKSKEQIDNQSFEVEVEDELIEDMDAEQGNTYEYILNDDNDEAEAESVSSFKDGIKIKLGTNRAETAIEDSDLFKELKFKMEEAEEEPVQREQGSEKSVQLEVEGSSESELVGALNEEQDEVGDDQDYIEILPYKGEQNSSDSGQTGQRRGRLSINSRNKAIDAVYQYNCPDCKRKYKNPTLYRKHMLFSHGSIVGQMPNLVCPVCKYDCATASRLKKHMAKHLPDDEKYIVPCPYCEKKFSKETAMKTHVNGIHHQLKPFICDQCGRACKTLSSLNEHQLVHTDECPFMCDVCQKQFKNKTRLKSHMDTHTESEYSCPDCNLKLNTKRTLLQHRLVHSNVKRFKCQFCDAAFKRSKALKNHLILHTGLRPYKCPFCEKSFSNGSNCRSHKKRAHPVELAHEEALGIKSEPTSIPKLEDLKAAKCIVQPRVLRRHERTKKDTTDDFDDVIGEGNYEIAAIQYEIEEELDADDGMEDESQDFVDGGEETVIYEIIGEV